MCAAATAVRRGRSANAVDVWPCVLDSPFTVADRDRGTDDRLRLLHTILLTERTDHLEYFATELARVVKHELARVVKHVIVLQGGMGIKATREAFARLAAVPLDAERLVLATGRYIGEGSTILVSTRCS